VNLVAFVGALVGAYLLGSLPFGYLITLLAKKIDIRTVGSGHTGGTNVLRVAGALPAAITMVTDFAKGWSAVALARAWAPGSDWAAALAGILVVVGHNHSVFLRFRGGVGTMATLGAAANLMPAAAIADSALAAVTVVATRYASLGSLLIAALLPVLGAAGAAIGAWPWPTVPFALACGLLSAWGLRANISRFRTGTERKIGQRVEAGPPR
jgi:glycerol-3-phosphate acyltransferase PlsY